MRIKLITPLLFSLLVGFVAPAMAQSYSKLWKDVETHEKKDLPRSVIETTDKIYRKATTEKNAPEMMKAYLYRMSYRQRLSVDSFYVDAVGLQTWLKTERDPLNQALLHSVLGEVYSRYFMLGRHNTRNVGFIEGLLITPDDWTPEALMKKSLYHFKQSLKAQKELSAANAADYLPIITQGTSSSVYGHDLLHTLALRAVRMLDANIWSVQLYFEQTEDRMDIPYWEVDDFLAYDFSPVSECDYRAEIMAMYQMLLKHYTEVEKTDAQLMLNLERLHFIHTQMYKGDWTVKNPDERLATSKYYQQLNKLRTKVGKIDTAVEVWNAMADFAVSVDNKKVALQLADEGISKFKSPRVSHLKNIKEMILYPALGGRVPESVYPGSEVTLSVYYNNLTELGVNIYKIDMEDSHDTKEKLKERLKDKTFFKEHVKLWNSFNYKLEPSIDYNQTDTTFNLTAPLEGVYLLELTTTDKKIEPVREFLYVTKMKVVSRRLPKDTVEYVVLDAELGHPVNDANLLLYKSSKEGYDLVNELAVDSAGTVRIAFDKSWNSLRVQKPGDENMYYSMLPYTYYREGKPQQSKEKISLFTDRAIYRPGQTVHVAGVVYLQDNDSTDVVVGKNYTLQLFDVNNKKIGEQYVRSNEFGSFSGQFVLPTAMLNGSLWLKVGESTTVVRVEEYKRPTFKVEFLPQEGSYTAGDSVKVRGVAKTYSGVPLQRGMVRYSVTRDNLPFWRMQSNAEVLAAGETMTDETGTFTLDVYLKPSESDKMFASWYTSYVIEAAVTDAAGETQSQEVRLPVGSSSVILSTDLPGRVNKDEKGTVTFSAKNLKQQPMELTGTYTVYELFGEDDKKEAGASLLSGSFTANKAFEPKKLRALPAGAYRIILTAKDDQSRPATYEQDFIVYSIEDVRPPVNTVNWFQQIDTEFGADKPAQLIFGTSQENVYMMYDVFSGDKHLESERILLTDTVLVKEYPYEEMYGDGILVQVAFVRNGNIYANEARFTRTMPQKELQMKWEVFRDKQRPGQREEWTLSIKSPEGEPVETELLAGLYDASLEKFAHHDWSMNLSFLRMLPSVRWGESYDRTSYVYFNFPSVKQSEVLLTYDDLITAEKVDIFSAFTGPKGRFAGYAGRGSVMIKGTANMVTDMAADMVFEEEMIPITQQEDVAPPTPAGAAPVQLRQNFNETAFFYPHLKTDEEGKVKFSFVMPESLTEWNFLGLSHTKKMDWGKLTGKTVVSKEFMLAPNMPRFVRLGDVSSISANVTNLSERAINGTVTLQLIEPMTNTVVFTQDLSFATAAGETRAVNFTFSVMREELELLTCRIIANGGGFSDGEQHWLPVVSNKVRVVESVPIVLKGKSNKDYDIDRLFNRNSKSATNRSLTVEYTGNPAWYAVQALPSLSTPDTDNVISWASAYYANNVAAYIANSNPRIQSVFAAWKAQGGTKETLWSNLQKNQELKNILLDETPWLEEAANEADQKMRLALLFDLNNMRDNNINAMHKLLSLQQENGSWAWYEGMQGSRYVTQYVVEQLLRLRQITGIEFNDEVRAMYTKAFGYLHDEAEKEYHWLTEMEKSNHKFLQVSELVLQYLYLCSIGKEEFPEKNKKVTAYFIEKLGKSMARLSIYGKAIGAIVLHENGYKELAADFMLSLQQYAVMTKDMGMYYDAQGAPYAWYNFKIPAHVAVMDATELITKNETMLEDMRMWLLNQKRTQAWESTSATVNAIHALLCKGGKEILNNNGNARITLGSRVMDINTSSSMVPGLGYEKRRFEEPEFKGVKSLNITKRDEGISWGAIHAQYMENIYKVTSTNRIFSVSKRLLVERIENGKVHLVPLGEGVELQVGDKLVSKLTLRVDRDLDFVHLKDQRAACLEPFVTTSGYTMQGGVGYYVSVKDASTDFFFDKLKKGTYIFEHSYYVVRKGVYSSGIAMLQSLYAPEFSAHSDAVRIKVD